MKSIFILLFSLVCVTCLAETKLNEGDLKIFKEAEFLSCSFFDDDDQHTKATKLVQKDKELIFVTNGRLGAPIAKWKVAPNLKTLERLYKTYDIVVPVKKGTFNGIPRSLK